MKRPYTVYKKYKALRDKHFQDYAKDALRVCPKNCRHNVNVPFPERGTYLRMCGLGQPDGGMLDPSKLLICSKVEQAVSCPVYSPLCRDKKDVARKMATEIPDMSARYPDLAMLDWVMDNTLHSMRKNIDNERRVVRWLFSLLGVIESLIYKIGSKS